MQQLFCRDLKAGDILLKMATNSLTHEIIRLGQQLAGQPNAFLAHAAIALDTQFAIEAQVHGISANHLAMRNEGCGYIVYRPNDPALGQGAANAAKMLFDIHQRQGNLSYGIGAAATSILGGPGKAKTGADFDALFDRIMSGKDQPFFCSQFVVCVYQWAAEQSGLPPEAVFSVSDAKASPSVLASKLVANPHFAEAGYMLPHER